ncbi:hemolysin XhlA family protein [uncultured Brevibacillus sp.]|uniref:hemolysin XhlA family protein n=1 Tax=uncultured Brevibacillus sp. TaxID=169970 RepID=UPI00259A7671|nr:hemolysin XhlA family protein [uncultured Brevibacillus sp.]
MPDQEMGRVLSGIRERLARVETKIDNMTDVRVTAEEAKEMANVAMQSSKSDHHRIDRIDKTIFWLGTTVVGAVILAIIKFIGDGRGWNG